MRFFCGCVAALVPQGSVTVGWLDTAFVGNAAAQASSEHPVLSTAGQAEVDAKVEAVLRQYGKLLSDAEKLDVRRLLSEGQKPLETMRAFPLDNSDQPADVLKLYPDVAARPVALSHPGVKK